VNQPFSLDRLPIATMQLLEQRALLERLDRKFVTDRTKLQRFLADLGSDYHLLLSDGKTWARYETCYYDTETLDVFHDHVRGRRPRYKVRVRRHVDRRRAFLEVKRKGVGDRTDKYRMERSYDQDELTPEELSFVAAHTPFDVTKLKPSVWTNFHRATLLGEHTEERLTIDFGLVFVRNGVQQELEDLAVVELKQRRCSHSSSADRALHLLGIRERSMSKYCAGVATLHEAARPSYRQLLLKRLTKALTCKTT
jgi:hypothetical protein